MLPNYVYLVNYFIFILKLLKKFSKNCNDNKLFNIEIWDHCCSDDASNSDKNADMPLSSNDNYNDNKNTKNKVAHVTVVIMKKITLKID